MVTSGGIDAINVRDTLCLVIVNDATNCNKFEVVKYLYKIVSF